MTKTTTIRKTKSNPAVIPSNNLTTVPVSANAPAPAPLTATPAIAPKPQAPTPTVVAAPPKPQNLTPKPVAKSPPHVLLELVRPGAKRVCVAGSFNEWQPDKTPLVLQGDGRWVGDLTIKPGRHEYLFVVDGQWVPDPNAKEAVQNPFGGTNSVLIVSA